jgi:anti-sigma factor RsiW
MQPSSPSQTLDQLIANLVDGNLSPTTRDGLNVFAAAHPTDQAGLLFMVLATPEFQLN